MQRDWQPRPLHRIVYRRAQMAGCPVPAGAHFSNATKPCGSLNAKTDLPLWFSRSLRVHRHLKCLGSFLPMQSQQRGPDISFTIDANKQQRQLIAELENKNREILQEIQRLRIEHEQASQPTPEKAQQNPTLLAELRLLRQRKDELEQRMSALQESRRELMVQLEGLMKLLKTQGAGSPRSSPSHTISRPIPMPIRSASACSTPTHTPQDSLTGVGGDVQEAFAQRCVPCRNLCQKTAKI
ncbi:unnamed protein product [Ranitomeya imitator]|uniref:Dystrobrevin beta n=1 Tax=Ranitomeya imitator TaxID=111125 RepID=A0ABN9KUR4_9NEOB|nr:unnamed protein product [Ranitomeya imitator]